MRKSHVSSLTKYTNPVEPISPIGTIATDQAQTGALAQPRQLYHVEVRNQGKWIAEHIVAARNALAAINLVELQYGEPLEAEIVKVENEDGRQRHVLVPKNWHGYTFVARLVAAD